MKVFNALDSSWVTVNTLTTYTGNFTVYDIKTSGVNDYIANALLLDTKTP
jgi:hypothetical protein